MASSSFCSFSAARGASASERRSTQPGHVDPLALQHDPAAVALGQVEHVVDQLGEAVDRFEDGGDIVRRRRRQLAGISRGQHLGEAADRGQRRAQFVAHVGDEVGLDLVGLLQRRRALAKRRLDPARNR